MHARAPRGEGDAVERLARAAGKAVAPGGGLEHQETRPVCRREGASRAPGVGESTYSVVWNCMRASNDNPFVSGAVGV